MRQNTSSHWKLGLGLTLLVLSLTPSAIFAHPMGNFSINHYSKLTVHADSVEIRYLIDKAEIPTFQDTRQFHVTPNADDPSAAEYLDGQVKLLGEGLSLKSDGEPLRLTVVSRRITFADGAGGLPTMKTGFTFSAKLPLKAGAHQLSYTDNNFPDRAGWKEIVVVGDHLDKLQSSAPGTDRSQELTVYSSDVLNSPPQLTSAMVEYRTLFATTKKAINARVRARPSPEVATPGFARTVVPPTVFMPEVATVPIMRAAQNTPRSRFTELISTQSKLSFWVLLSAALIAAGLGALHALEPGHGKTVVAAYLVGSRGTARHAVLLGIVVAAAHTTGVYLLGAATLYASRYIVPEQLYPWLGTISGLSVVGLGAFIFLRHWTGETAEHSHMRGEQHSHWFLSMFQPGRSAEPITEGFVAADAKRVERPLSLRELCMLGITGGIVPCPAALVVLLSAFSLHRIGFGLFLITAFSFGLAAVLVGVGLAMVYAKRVLASRFLAASSGLRYLPFLSSGFMVVLGVGITASAVAPLHLWTAFAPSDKLVPFLSMVLFGLFLGMRHSTDADHVVAVSTIVSRQKSIGSSATIGLLWGLGHTLTIFLVGSAIIIFGVVIPPRLGLSMEFCVALMLILLGVLNLTGVIRWTTERLTPQGNAGGQEPAEFVQGAGEGARRKNRRVSAGVGRLLAHSVGKLGLYQTVRPFVIGLVHGLAGSAAVALLVLSTIKSPLWSTLYLLVFGFGTMLGMMLMTAAISVPLIYSGKRFFHFNRHLTTLSGVASTAFGLFLVYQIGFVDGLFRSQVHWIPQ